MKNMHVSNLLQVLSLTKAPYCMPTVRSLQNLLLTVREVHHAGCDQKP
jgi:hypothetical protein